jgi:hypothetical protein
LLVCERLNACAQAGPIMFKQLAPGEFEKERRHIGVGVGHGVISLGERSLE